MGEVMPNILLKLFETVEEDAARLAEIHMASFSFNTLMLAAFPTPDIRRSLRQHVEQNITRDIIASNKTVQIVRAIQHDSMVGEQQQRPGNGVDISDGRGTNDHAEIIAFARWGHPLTEIEETQVTSRVWPEETNVKLLEKWIQLVDETQQQVLGETQCYRLNFICTDPSYERLGAATMLLRWGLKRSLLE